MTSSTNAGMITTTLIIVSSLMRTIFNDDAPNHWDVGDGVIDQGEVEDEAKDEVRRPSRRSS